MMPVLGKYQLRNLFSKEKATWFKIKHFTFSNLASLRAIIDLDLKVS